MKIRIPVVLGLIVLTVSDSKVTAQTFQWVKEYSSPAENKASYTACDANGNVFTTMYFLDSINTDPGSPGTYFYSAGSYDILISKLDYNGNHVWAKRIGGSAHDSNRSIAIDQSNNVYIAGYFDDTVDFDPGPAVFNLISNGGQNTFILKLDNNGNFIWAKRLAGTSDLFTYRIVIDNTGNVLICGNFYGTADFDPGAGVANLVSSGEDIFVAKYDNAGNYIWARKMGGTGHDYALAVSTDQNSNVYTTGSFELTADFDPGAGIANLVSAGNDDIFISKLDANGIYQWGKRVGGTQDDQGTCIKADGAGNTFITGMFKSIVDFDPGAGTYNINCGAGTEVFILKLGTAGNFIWAKSFVNISNDVANDMILDGALNIYITGNFTNSTDFDPSPTDTVTLVPAGGADWDMYISKLDSGGNFMNVWQLGGAGIYNEHAASVAVDAIGNIYTTGYTYLQCDFDPGTGVFNVTPMGNMNLQSNSFIHKLGMGNDYIEETKTDNRLLVFPNPASESFMISTQTNATYIYEINNSLGQTIEVGNFRRNTIIHTAHWQHGMYVVRVSDGKNGWNQKLVKE